jgi:hypothetical protein
MGSPEPPAAEHRPVVSPGRRSLYLTGDRDFADEPSETVLSTRER